MFHNAVFPRPTSRNIIYVFDRNISGHEIYNVPRLLVLLIGCCSMLICEPVKLKGCLIRLQFYGYVRS